MKDHRALRPTLWQGLTLRDLINAAMVEAPAAGLITDIGLDGRRLHLTARALDHIAMPLYLWNFGPVDHDHAAPLSDLLNGEAPARLLPLHPPAIGDGPIMTLWDRGDGPEPVLHHQDGLLAQAVLARLSQTSSPARIISALSLNTQAGLILGPLRALLTRTPLTLIGDPSSANFTKAMADEPADCVVPAPLASALRARPEFANTTLTTLARAEQIHDISAASFIAFGEALTLPTTRRGHPLQPGPISAETADGLLHFAELKMQIDGGFTLASPLAGTMADDIIASPALDAHLGSDGQFTRFTVTQGRAS